MSSESRTKADEEQRRGLAKRILIVEDDFLIALATEELLQGAGYEVVGTAATFDDAISLAEQMKPDLVLMDIQLASRRDGVEAAIEIRNRFGIGSLFTSANQDPTNVGRAQPAAPLGWVPKPYARQTLLDAVERVV